MLKPDKAPLPEHAQSCYWASQGVLVPAQPWGLRPEEAQSERQNEPKLVLTSIRSGASARAGGLFGHEASLDMLGLG